MLKEFKKLLVKIHSEESGSYMVEMALVLVGVALTVFAAASALSTNGIIPKYNDITDEIKDVAVPSLS